MRVPRNLGSFFAALACVNLLVPLPLLEAAKPPAVTKSASQEAASNPSLAAGDALREAASLVACDVTLVPTNGLQGTLVDKSGAGLANRVVVAVHADKSNARSVTDANGQFRFPQAKPGVYQVVSDESYQVCRCWAANTSPPSATPGLLLVEGDQTLRGQRPIGEILSGPVLIGLIIAAAIVIPIAVHNSQKSAS